MLDIYQDALSTKVRCIFTHFGFPEVSRETIVWTVKRVSSGNGWLVALAGLRGGCVTCIINWFMHWIWKFHWGYPHRYLMLGRFTYIWVVWGLNLYKYTMRWVFGLKIFEHLWSLTHVQVYHPQKMKVVMESVGLLNGVNVLQENPLSNHDLMCFLFNY